MRTFAPSLHRKSTDFLILLLQDRFAEDRAPPTIDESQDWYLDDGVEENGFTILEFSRKFITCDDKDLPITVSDCLACLKTCP